MKKTMTMGAIWIALITALSCSETETGIDPAPGGDDGQVALGINPNLKVEGTKAATKSVVSGEAITYPAEQFSSADYAPGLGVLVTNSSINGWYSSDGDRHHIWYIGDERGANWISITTKGGTYATTKETPYYLTSDIGKVYAYYPYDASLTSSLSSITGESSLKIPITVSASGEIDASTNNAKKSWNTDSWTSNNRTNLVNLSLTTEKDYLYFAGTDGRNVNNGRVTGQPPVTPDAEPNNTDENNPGYKIKLDMKHAMAMVSLRVYDGGHLSNNDVNFTKFEIKNHSGSSNNYFKVGNGKMSLKDGAITETTTTTGMARTITNYILMRQVEEGETEGEHAFISTGTSTSSTNGKTVSKTVSAIVYPINNFGDNEIDVEITLKETGGSEVVYPVYLPGNTWEAGKNYIYTFSAGRNKLTLVDVKVEAWEDKEQEEIPL